MYCYGWVWIDMEVVITGWALQSYLDLKHKHAFTNAEYHTILRPDAERLKAFPSDPKFRVNSFWGPATKGNGVNVGDGYKMKWDSIGPGKNELRVCIAIIGPKAFLCQAYIKKGKNDIRECLSLERYINLIRIGRYYDRGRI
jgi:hypothetical protein